MTEDFEKLGVFYLGKKYDLANKKVEEDLILYDSKDLVTHAVCVGMTGSGKTGLCLALIEEAALDGIPAILIDPKGDLGNLLLTFPDLLPENFRPWVNEDDARNKGMTIDEYAAQQAQTWTKGINSWGQDGERIRKLREAVDFRIYTPGSNSGIPVSILHSFKAPPEAQREDNEFMRDKVITTVTSLLQLIGIDADPNQSRESILLANLLDHNWRKGIDLSLEALITQIQTPPIQKIGVMDLDMYFPAKERFSLVMALNNLLASPGFNIWLEGDALDIDEIIRTKQGKPRVAIFSIAHLNDAERMFFVSLLLNQVLGWMRSQSGTNSLRTILYMDEIFGFLPPTAKPSSKLPMLTLLKQARAFGLGLVLATQNPVDLDYKALSNAGTWFIGRLQTERDKARLIEGLEGAAAAQTQKFDKQKMEQIIAGLGNRVFLMNNVHDDAPVVFTTRWVMSYMRGPLTRDQIKLLMDPVRKSESNKTTSTPTLETTERKQSSKALVGGMPTLPHDIQPVYLPVRHSGRETIYYPAVLAAVRTRFVDTKLRIDQMETGLFATFITENAIPVDWQKGKLLKISPDLIEKTGKADAAYDDLPDAGRTKSNYANWSKDFLNWVVAAQPLTLMRSPSRGLISEPGESEKDFRIRVAQTKRENRDDQLDKIREKYSAKTAALQDKIDKAQIRVAKERGQATNAAISLGASVLGALTGRRSTSKLSTALRGVGRSTEQSTDVRQAKATVNDLKDQLKELETEFEEEKKKMGEGADPLTETLETVQVKLKKTDITVQLVTLAWLPFSRDETGKLSAAW